MPKAKNVFPAGNAPRLGAQRWDAADALRNDMDAGEYNRVARGLFSLKNIADALAAKHAELKARKAEGRPL